MDPWVRPMTREEHEDRGRFLLIVLVLVFVLFPITGLLVIRSRGWENTPGWFKTLWICSLPLGAYGLFRLYNPQAAYLFEENLRVELISIGNNVQISPILPTIRSIPAIYFGIPVLVIFLLGIMGVMKRLAFWLRFVIGSVGILLLFAFFISSGFWH